MAEENAEAGDEGVEKISVVEGGVEIQYELGRPTVESRPSTAPSVANLPGRETQPTEGTDWYDNQTARFEGLPYADRDKVEEGAVDAMVNEISPTSNPGSHTLFSRVVLAMQELAIETKERLKPSGKKNTGEVDGDAPLPKRTKTDAGPSAGEGQPPAPAGREDPASAPAGGPPEEGPPPLTPRPARLAPCPDPPAHGTPGFIPFAKNALAEAVFPAMYERDEIHEDALSTLTILPGTPSLHDLFEVVTGRGLSTDQLKAIKNNPKPIGEYKASEIAALWCVSDAFLEDNCRGYNSRDTRWGAWVTGHPFPVGPEDKPKGTNRSDSLATFYNLPAVHFALYIYWWVKCLDNGTLRADAPKVGTLDGGYHWTCVGSSEKTAISMHGRELVSVRKLAGFVTSLPENYFHIISDEKQFFKKKNGQKIHYGREWMQGTNQKKGSSATCHLKCFTGEKLGHGGYANLCFSVGGPHTCCADQSVNVGAHERCLGQLVVVVPESDGFETRYLVSLCKCADYPGNPGKQQCSFTSYIFLDTAKLAVETVKDGQSIRYQDYRKRNVEAPSNTNDGHGKTSAKIAAQATSPAGVLSQVHQLMELDDEDEADPNKTMEVLGAEDGVHIDLEDTCLMLFDSETTGLSVKGDRMIELGSREVTYKGMDENAYCAYVKPDGKYTISDEAYEVNRITKDMLCGRRGTKEELRGLFGFWNKAKGERSLCVVGHNIAKFDLPLLENEAKRCGLSGSLPDIEYIDTLQLFDDDELWQSFGKVKPSSISLGNLHKYVFGEKIKGAHSAMGDVKANNNLLLKLDPKLEHAARYKKIWKWN